MQIVDLTGLNWPEARLALDLFDQGGMSAIRPVQRGRKTGICRSLQVEQEQAIQRVNCDKRPEQLKMDFALWSRAAVMHLMDRDYGIKLSVRGVGNYLARCGFTPQKTIKKAYEQRLEAVRTSLDEQYPAIEAKARAEGGEIHWGDETALVHTDVRSRSYALAGQSNTHNVCTRRHPSTAVDDTHHHEQGPGSLDNY